MDDEFVNDLKEIVPSELLLFKKTNYTTRVLKHVKDQISDLYMERLVLEGSSHVSVATDETNNFVKLNVNHINETTRNKIVSKFGDVVYINLDTDLMAARVLLN